MPDFEGVIHCMGCGADSPYMGRAPSLEAIEKQHESMGYVKVGDNWLCLVCSGSLPALLSQRPDLAEWFAKKGKEEP